MLKVYIGFVWDRICGLFLSINFLSWGVGYCDLRIYVGLERFNVSGELGIGVYFWIWWSVKCS